MYFTHVLPRLGRIISRHDAAYTYLPESVGAFALPDEFVKLLRQAGFVNISASPLTFGVVYLYTACRGQGLESPEAGTGAARGESV